MFCDFNTLLSFSNQNYFETSLFKIFACTLFLKFSNTLKHMILNRYLFLTLNIHAELSHINLGNMFNLTKDYGPSLIICENFNI